MKHPSRLMEMLLAALIVTIAMPAVPVHAEEHGHLVSRLDLQQRLEQSSATRAQHIETIQRSLAAYSEAEGQLGVPNDTIERAVTFLSDDELARLAARAEESIGDVSGTGLSTMQIWLIVIAGSVALLILTILVYNDAIDSLNQ